MNDSVCVKNLEKILGPKNFYGLNPPPFERCGEFNNRMKRVPIARVLNDVGFCGWYHWHSPGFWDDFLFFVEILHQNPVRCFNRVLKTLDLYYRVNDRIPEHFNMIGVPDLRFSRDREDGVWRCVIAFNDDTGFLVDTWFKYDEGKVMDRAKLKRKIQAALWD